MSLLTVWSNRLQMESWITFSVLVTVVSVVSQSVLSLACPRDLETHVSSCFADYSIHYQNLNNSPKKLCCGVDVETLRGFCHSYTSALRCVNALKTACPSTQHHVIDRMLNNLDGESKAGLMDLCKDDQVFEAYAMNQWCFEMVGTQSEECFTSHLKESSSIRFLSKVNTKHKETFCRNMRDTVGCVRRNVERRCPQAANLAVLLVRPMVRDSSQCDYSIVKDNSMESKTTGRDRPAYISDDSRFNRDSKSGSSEAENSNKNQRRHRDRNSNSEPHSNPNSNDGSHGGGNPEDGAVGVHSSMSYGCRVVFTVMSLLLTAVLSRVLASSNC